MKKRFSNANITNYILAFLFVMVVVVSTLVFYQYYVNGVYPPNEFLTVLFGTVFVEFIAMAGIAISKNIGKEKEEEYYE